MRTDCDTLLLSTAYFPPTAWFALIAGATETCIENHENYSKQSYRNRCCIMSANGLLPLVIPVKRKRGRKTPVTEISPDYSYPWQRLHHISIESAYRSAPFYEYYIDEIIPLLEKRYSRLIELNNAISERMFKILEIENEPTETNSYENLPGPGTRDFRERLHPKKGEFNTRDIIGYPEYRQVFSDRHGFMPNLSIIDLLFNIGPDAPGYIRRLSKLIRVSGQKSAF